MKGTPGLVSRLYMIRHGETAWSLSGQHTGRSDIALTDKGELDARDLAAPLRAVRFGHVFTSPRQRARRTCELIGLDGIAQIEPDLAEWDYGDYEGLGPVEIQKRRPGWNIFRDGCPHGESPAQISDRADRFIARVRLLNGNIGIFSHGHFGRVLAARWIGLPTIQAKHFLLRTASLSILGYEHDAIKDPAIILWNAVSKDVFDIVPDQRRWDRRAIERWETEGGEIPVQEDAAGMASQYVPPQGTPLWTRR